MISVNSVFSIFGTSDSTAQLATRAIHMVLTDFRPAFDQELFLDVKDFLAFQVVAKEPPKFFMVVPLFPTNLISFHKEWRHKTSL